MSDTMFSFKLIPSLETKKSGHWERKDSHPDHLFKPESVKVRPIKTAPVSFLFTYQATDFNVKKVLTYWALFPCSETGHCNMLVLCPRF